jgi:hypothetical protein
MSTAYRRGLFGATAATWLAWLTAEWMQASPDIPTGVVHAVLTVGLRLLVLIGSLSCVLAWLVDPMITTARVWFEIGKREQECRVVPIRPVRRLTGSDQF